MHAARPNALNTEALERISALYKIEEAIRGKPPDERRAYRQTHARPLLEQFHTWLNATQETLSRKSDMSRAILYALNRWAALTRDCDDGRLEIDNLPVERAASIYSLIGTAKLNNLDPKAYLRAVLTHITRLTGSTSSHPGPWAVANQLAIA